MKASDYDYLIGMHSGDYQRIENTLEAVSDFICEAGMDDDLVIITPDNRRVLNTFGIYIDRCADKDYLEQLLPVLIPKQMEIDGTDCEHEL
ncbi:MAG: hypothetical protein PHD46_07085 [Eubacteriales bacterium]|nr:hypothetical protein [Eubacteriales bacterium]